MINMTETQPTFSELTRMLESGERTSTILRYVVKLQRHHAALQTRLKESRYENFCPLDFKYHDAELVPYLSAAAEVRYCVDVHTALMDGLREFGLATEDNVRELEAYIKNPNLETILDFPLNNNFDKIMLGSRLKSGFDVSLIEQITHKSQAEVLKLLKSLSYEGLIELSGSKVHLTEKGMFVNNEILLKLI